MAAVSARLRTSCEGAVAMTRAATVLTSVDDMSSRTQRQSTQP